MDTKDTKPGSTGTTARNPQASNPGKSTTSYVNPDVAQPANINNPNAASNQSAEGSLIDSALESGKSALESGKRWIEDSGISETVNQQAQNVKDWSKRATDRVSSLSTTQKVVGGALLAAGLGWLALRGKSGKDQQPNIYGRKGKTGSNFGRQQGYRQDSNDSGRGRRSGVLSSMPSFGGSSNRTPTPGDSYDQSPVSGDNRSRYSGSSTVSDNVNRYRSGGSGYRADE